VQLTLNRLIDANRYPQEADRDKARTVLIAVSVILLAFTLTGALLPFRTAISFEFQTYFGRAAQFAIYPLYSFAAVMAYVLCVATLIGVRGGYVRQIALVPVLAVYILLLPPLIQTNIAHADNAYLLLIGLVLAGMLDGERGLFFAAPIHFILIVVAFVTTINDEAVAAIPTHTANTLILMLFASATILGFLLIYRRLLTRSRAQQDVAASSRRVKLAQLTTRITRSISDVSELDRVLSDIVQDVLLDYPAMYHVQVFLVDDTGRVANLVASTGEVGQQLLDRHHSLPVGSLSVIGQVTQRQEPIVAVVGGENSVHRPNDLLPDTRLEVALPIGTGGRNIGALDLQSKRGDVLAEDDLTTLQAIADSIAITITNARLLEQTQQRLVENERLVESMAAARQEVQRLRKELTGNIWADFLRGQSNSYNFDLDFEANRIANSESVTASIADAIDRREIVRRTDPDGTHIVAVPLRVRGEVIGAMEFEVDDDLSPEDLNMLSEVGERFGLAAENNRLYQSSQRIAQREALVNEISTKIQAATSVETTLAVAARSLRDVLKAKHISIQLGPSTDTSNT
jgi:GAF domain-containing protein